MPLDGEYEPSPEKWVRDQVELYESSGGTQGTTLRDTGLPVVIMTNRGVRSGKLRKTPVMRVEHEGRYVAVASKGGAPEHPVWYANLLAHPLVELLLHRREALHAADVVDPAHSCKPTQPGDRSSRSEPLDGVPVGAARWRDPDSNRSEPLGERWSPVGARPMARPGLEPGTPRFSVVCSTN